MNHLEMLDFIRNKLSADVVKMEVGNYIFDGSVYLPDNSYNVSIIKGYQCRAYRVYRDSSIELEAECIVRLATVDFQFPGGTQHLIGEKVSDETLH